LSLLSFLADEMYWHWVLLWDADMKGLCDVSVHMEHQRWNISMGRILTEKWLQCFSMLDKQQLVFDGCCFLAWCQDQWFSHSIELM
jgi:hypothetical protein